MHHTGVQLGRLFLDRGDIVLIADSAGVRDIYSAEGNAELPRTPLAVLVNKGTASASEVGGFTCTHTHTHTHIYTHIRG